jgi:hypothetical protein
MFYYDTAAATTYLSSFLIHHHSLFEICVFIIGGEWRHLGSDLPVA